MLLCDLRQQADDPGVFAHGGGAVQLHAGVLLAGFLLGMTQVISARFDPNAGLLYVHLVFFAALVWRALRGGLR